MSLYENRHRSQYDPGASAFTRVNGCTWTTGANGADAQSGGKVDKTPDQIHDLVKRSEEVYPQTPGWHLGDLAKAMGRIGVSFVNRTGQGWGAVRLARDSGLYIVLQGDSDRFGNATCSGAFDGDHAIGIHPDDDDAGRWRIDDPICKYARYESEDTLRKYAEKLSPKVYFGVFTTKVPPALPDTSTEAAMEFTSKGPRFATARMIADWRLWRVRDDKATAAVKAGTVFDVRGVVTYHKGSAKPEGYTGYLVEYAGEAHVLPSDRVSVLTVVGA